MMETKTNQNKVNISDAEWEVMRIVWTLGSIHTGDIIQQLQAKKSWSESTIKTLMRRLVQKGLLETKKDGRRFLYSATVTENQMMVRVTRELMDSMCDMHKGQLLLEMMKDVPLSKNDIAKLESELQLRKAAAPEIVNCNCLAVENDHCKELASK